jgi:transposase-like protein
MNQAPAKPRRKYDHTFRRQAVTHWLTSGRSAEVIAAELGLTAKQLYAWKKRFAPAGAGETKPATLAEAQAQLDAAQREIRHLREQRDILKKTLGILSEPPLNATNGSR